MFRLFYSPNQYIIISQAIHGILLEKLLKTIERRNTISTIIIILIAAMALIVSLYGVYKPQEKQQTITPAKSITTEQIYRPKVQPGQPIKPLNKEKEKIISSSKTPINKNKIANQANSAVPR